MFALSLVDTLRLVFGQVVYHHKAHTRAARLCLRLSRWFRATETLLMMGVVVATVGAASGRGGGYALTSAVLASVALVVFFIHMMFDFDASARAHHASGTSLWHAREQYRALLSDLNDGAIEPEAARARRDALMNELHAVYQSAPPIAAEIYNASGTSGSVADGAEESALAGEEIDRFLPKSLREPRKATTAVR
jgi:hypothetical protein